MSKKPASAKTPVKPAAKASSPAVTVKVPVHNTAPVSVLARIPHDILAGLDKRVASGEFRSRNQALVFAVLEFGTFTPKVRAELKAEFLDEPVSLASRVTTAAPDAPVPGARLDKASIGKSAGKPRPAKGKGGRAAAADEVIV